VVAGAAFRAFVTFVRVLRFGLTARRGKMVDDDTEEGAGKEKGRRAKAKPKAVTKMDLRLMVKVTNASAKARAWFVR